MDSAKLFKRLLVAVDSEGRAANAVIQGSKLAHRLGSRLDLIHAVEVPPALWPGLGEAERAAMHATTIVTERRKTLDSLKPALSEAGVDLNLDECLRVELGPPAKVILERASEQESDLIVLGPHDKTSLFDFGSTARNVFAHARCPVWKQASPAVSIEKILVPIDFSEHSQPALEYAQALAKRFEARVQVLHCHVSPSLAYATASGTMPTPTPAYVFEKALSSAKSQLEDWMKKLDWGSVEVETLFVEGVPHRTILAEAEKCDLTVMGSHGHTALSRFLMGSVANNVLKHSQKPVLMVPKRDREWSLDASTNSTQEAQAQ